MLIYSNFAHIWLRCQVQQTVDITSQQPRAQCSCCSHPCGVLGGVTNEVYVTVHESCGCTVHTRSFLRSCSRSFLRVLITKPSALLLRPQKFVLASFTAPAAMSSLRASTWPPCAARCNGGRGCVPGKVAAKAES